MFSLTKVPKIRFEVTEIINEKIFYEKNINISIINFNENLVFSSFRSVKQALFRNKKWFALVKIVKSKNILFNKITI